MDIHKAYYYSPIGTIAITGNEEGIATLYFVDSIKKTSANIHPSLKDCIQQLDEYFSSSRKEFDLKLKAEDYDSQDNTVNIHSEKLDQSKLTDDVVPSQPASTNEGAIKDQ